MIVQPVVEPMDRFAVLFTTHLLCAEVEAEVAGSLGVPVLLHGAVQLRGPQLLRSAQWWLESGVLVFTRVVLFTTSCVVCCIQSRVVFTTSCVVYTSGSVTSHQPPPPLHCHCLEHRENPAPAASFLSASVYIYTLSTHSRYYLHTRYLDRVVVTPLLCPPYSTGWWSRWLYTTLADDSHLACTWHTADQRT